MENKPKNIELGQEQFYDLLVSREVSWQSIIYDLIKTGQLDPWNIDLILLSKKYMERLQQLEEEGIFFISSKVLLAAAILLRIKSEILHENIQAIDELLFEKKKKEISASELMDSTSIIDFTQEDYEILPRTPLPRARKVTLQELMNALNRAINTEHRRIKKELFFRRRDYDASFVLPKKTINIGQKIKELYNKIKSFFAINKDKKLTYSELTGTGRDEKIACFLPLLHLDSQEKIFVEQEKPFSEINIWLKKIKIPESTISKTTMTEIESLGEETESK